MPITIPNILTLTRILAIPIFVVAYFLAPDDDHRIPVIIFLFAAITDWLDGFLARKLGKVSPFGTFLDPVADKLIVCSALVLLASNRTLAEEALFAAGLITAIIIIVCREVSVVALREWMAEIGQRASVATSFLSKAKTVLQMVAIVLLLFGQPIAGIPILIIGELLLYIAAILTLWTMYQYLRIAWPLITQGNENLM